MINSTGFERAGMVLGALSRIALITVIYWAVFQGRARFVYGMPTEDGAWETALALAVFTQAVYWLLCGVARLGRMFR